MNGKYLTACLVGLGIVFLGADTNAQPPQPQPNPRVLIETSEGDITVELYRSDARVSVSNFLAYVRDSFYDNTIFHRVIRNFMIQGGGVDEGLEPKTDGLRGGVLNEARNGLKNERGTIAVARTANPNSGTAQFFINTADNTPLDHKNTTDTGYGYAVFGRVVDGMDVVDTIGRKPTYTTVTGLSDVPRRAITIHQIRRID
jgi:cyclophilin family peptidyl-prolyl cis-trans isomerase